MAVISIPVDFKTTAAQRAAEVEAATWSALRTERDHLLAAGDPLIMRHRDQLDAGTVTTLTTEQYAALLTYRQALRDLPELTGDPADPVWPAAPEL